MRTVIVEDVETAEAKKQRLATTAVDAALEILRTEASGLVIEAAAPLVFQGLCRRDNIRVEFTQTPMTNGRVIWLGPIDLGHKLASIYVYGHGCHERHHVMYTNFAAMRGIGDPGVRDLANVFEDIRVDQLGAADYEGYLLWRLVLFKAHEATGTAGWSNPNDLGKLFKNPCSQAELNKIVPFGFSLQRQKMVFFCHQNSIILLC